MIGFIRGTVHAFGIDYVLIDTGGVGYRINFYHPEALMKGKERKQRELLDQRRQNPEG